MCRCSLGRLAPTLLLIAAASGSAGCSGEPRANVSGTVTLDGAALKNRVRLTFVGADHVPRSTLSDDSGAFSLAGLPIGEVTVTLVSVPAGGPKPRPRARIKDPSPDRHADNLPPLEEPEVPEEYGDAANPLLTFQLKEGDNLLPIDVR